MKKYNHEFVVRCDIEKVWDFFMDPKHFEAISPKDLNETLMKCSTSRLALGTDLWISTNLFAKKKWHSRIIRFKELHEFADEVQKDRLLKKWIHSHRFTQIDAKRTLMIDDISFQFCYGIIGKVIERIVVPRLEHIFSYREQKIKEILE